MDLKWLENLEQILSDFGKVCRMPFMSGEMWELRLDYERFCLILQLQLLPGCTRLNARSGFPLLHADPEDWIKQANESLRRDYTAVYHAVDMVYCDFITTVCNYDMSFETMKALSERLSGLGEIVHREPLSEGEIWEFRLGHGPFNLTLGLKFLPGCTRVSFRSAEDLYLIDAEDWIKQANESLLDNYRCVFPAIEVIYGHFKNTVGTYQKRLAELSQKLSVFGVVNRQNPVKDREEWNLRMSDGVCCLELVLRFSPVFTDVRVQLTNGIPFKDAQKWTGQANESLLEDHTAVFPAMEQVYGHFKNTFDTYQKRLADLSEELSGLGEVHRIPSREGEMLELRLNHGRFCHTFSVWYSPSCTHVGVSSGKDNPLKIAQKWMKQANESLRSDYTAVYPALEQVYGHFKNTVDTYLKMMEGLPEELSVLGEVTEEGGEYLDLRLVQGRFSLKLRLDLEPGHTSMSLAHEFDRDIPINIAQKWIKHANDSLRRDYTSVIPALKQVYDQMENTVDTHLKMMEGLLEELSVLGEVTFRNLSTGGEYWDFRLVQGRFLLKLRLDLKPGHTRMSLAHEFDRDIPINIAQKWTKQANDSLRRDYTSVTPALKQVYDQMKIWVDQQPDCVICLESVIAEDCYNPCKTCKVTFHRECLHNWFSEKSANSCPVCRRTINM